LKDAKRDVDGLTVEQSGTECRYQENKTAVIFV
jgi:hypothetical protein